MSITEALAANKGKLVTISGKVVEIKEAWSSYNNMSVYIEDENGAKIYVYRTKTQVNLGDVITVSGKVDEYNGAKQIGSGSTATVDVAHVCSEWNDATCTAPKTCKGCGKTEGEKLDHTYGEDGKCSCGAEKPTDSQTKVTVSIADYADTNAWENSTQYTELNVDSNVKVTVSGTAVGDYGVNTGKYYTNGENWRIYQNENPSVTITAAEGKTIVSVKVTYAVKNTGTLTLNGENVASDTVVSVNANSIAFSVGNTGTATNGQAQITAIEVVYE